MKRIVVDSIDKKSNKANLEINGTRVVIDLGMLPETVKEGDILKLIIDEEGTDSVRSRVQELENRLFN